ncbi:hypothetical protein BT96DRAFT_830619, partial [Gymnopus androsaceus JB14]
LAAETLDPRLSLCIETRSKYLHSILKEPSKLDDGGFFNTRNASALQSTIASLRARRTPTLISLSKGEDNYRNGKGARDQANVAARKDRANYVNVSPQPMLQVTGAKLTTLTQGLAYKIIKDIQTKKNEMVRRRTEGNLNRIKDSIQDRFDYIPTSESIWKAIRHKDLEKKTRDFMWIITHDAYWTGTHWLRGSMGPELQERAFCALCGKVDDFRHILTKCESPGQNIIWHLAGKVWDLKKKYCTLDLPQSGRHPGLWTGQGKRWR